MCGTCNESCISLFNFNQIPCIFPLLPVIPRYAIQLSYMQKIIIDRLQVTLVCCRSPGIPFGLHEKEIYFLDIWKLYLILHGIFTYLRYRPTRKAFRWKNKHIHTTNDAISIHASCTSRLYIVYEHHSITSLFRVGCSLWQNNSNLCSELMN